MNELDPAAVLSQSTSRSAHTGRTSRTRGTRSPLSPDTGPAGHPDLPQTKRIPATQSTAHACPAPAVIGHQIAQADVMTTARSVPVDVVAAAAEPGARVCDIACEAMPAHICGDLTPPENVWLATHTDHCSYCARELTRYEKVDAVLDHLHGALDPLSTPPRFVLPTAGAPVPATSKRSRVAARAARRSAHVGLINSPVGALRVAVSDVGVAEISFTTSETDDEFRARVLARGFDLVPSEPTASDLAPVTAQLSEYFQGTRQRFDLPIDFGGLTPFTRSVLGATADVPFGEVKTYGDIAAQIGSPGASRAVGNALGRNPIPVIVPCHRIVMSDLTIGGYTGGIDIKERLLAIEGVRPRDLGME